VGRLSLCHRSLSTRRAGRRTSAPVGSCTGRPGIVLSRVVVDGEVPLPWCSRTPQLVRPFRRARIQPSDARHAHDVALKVCCTVFRSQGAPVLRLPSGRRLRPPDAELSSIDHW